MAVQEDQVFPNKSTNNEVFEDEGEESEEGEKSSDLKNDFKEVNIDHPRFTYERDFCIRVANVIAPEYATSEVIKKLIQEIINSKLKKDQISGILRLYNEVYKNNILNTQMKAIFEEYRRGSENAPKLESQDRHRIEKSCVKLFGKIPPAQALILSIHNEFLATFRLLDDINFSALINIFFGQRFIGDCLHSALFITRNAELFTKIEDEELALVSAAQQVVFVIQTLRKPLEEVFGERNYQILSERQVSKEKLVAVDKEVRELKEVNEFLKSYLLEIVHDQLDNQKQVEGSVSSLLKDQLIRLPFLIAAMQKMTIAYPPSAYPTSAQLEQQSGMLDDLEPGLDRSALSIIQKLDREVDPRGSNHSELKEPLLHYQDKALIVSVKFDTNCCHKMIAGIKRHEPLAAMIDRLPIISVTSDIGAISLELKKFLSLYPGTINTVGPHKIWIELGVAIFATLVARDEIQNPRKNRFIVRIWKATTNGLILLAFGVNISINIYLSYHPGVMNISNEEFRDKIASYPAAIVILHTLWHLVPPLSKEKCCVRGSIWHRIKLGADIFFNTLYNAGVFYFVGLTFFTIPKALFNQIFLPLILGLPVAIGQQTRHLREKLTTLRTLTNFGTFAYYIIKNSSANSPDRAFEGAWQVAIRSSILGLELLYSFILFKINYNRYKREYINEDDMAEFKIMMRKISVPIKEGQMDVSSFLNQGMIIDMKDFYEIENDFHAGRIEQAKQKTLLIMYKNQDKRHDERSISLQDARKTLRTNEKEVKKPEVNKPEITQVEINKGDRKATAGKRFNICGSSKCSIQ